MTTINNKSGAKPTRRLRVVHFWCKVTRSLAMLVWRCYFSYESQGCCKENRLLGDRRHTYLYVPSQNVLRKPGINTERDPADYNWVLISLLTRSSYQIGTPHRASPNKVVGPTLFPKASPCTTTIRRALENIVKDSRRLQFCRCWNPSNLNTLRGTWTLRKVR